VIINGIALGGMYTVLVLGFTIIWGVLGIINFAHGELVMAGAYLAWLANGQAGLDPFVATPIVFVVMVAAGYVIQRLVVNRVIDRPHLVSLLVMYGLSIILANGMKLLGLTPVERM